MPSSMVADRGSAISNQLVPYRLPDALAQRTSQMVVQPRFLDIEYMKRIIFAVLVLSSGASAQERQFTITIPESQLNYIGKIVGKQPYEDSGDVLNSIRNQVADQMRREADAAREALRNEMHQTPKQETKP